MSRLARCQLAVLLGLLLPAPRAGVAAAHPLVLAHYMPWYATKDVSGHWGWHWTMNHFDLEKRGADGQREAASHDYPLIGLYDSSDPDVLASRGLEHIKHLLIESIADHRQRMSIQPGRRSADHQSPN